MSGHTNPNQAPQNPYGNQPQYPQQGHLPQGYYPQQPNIQPPAGYQPPTGYQQPYSAYNSGQDTSGESGGSGIPGWLIWIAILIGFNVCSYLFDWPIWIY